MSSALGIGVGESVGSAEGLGVGCRDGFSVGCGEGMGVGSRDGFRVGTGVGASTEAMDAVVVEVSAVVVFCMEFLANGDARTDVGPCWGLNVSASIAMSPLYDFPTIASISITGNLPT